MISYHKCYSEPPSHNPVWLRELTRRRLCSSTLVELLYLQPMLGIYYQQMLFCQKILLEGLALKKFPGY